MLRAESVFKIVILIRHMEKIKGAVYRIVNIISGNLRVPNFLKKYGLKFKETLDKFPDLSKESLLPLPRIYSCGYGSGCLANIYYNKQLSKSGLSSKYYR